MEVILVIIIFWFGGSILRAIFSAGAKTVSAVGRTAAGKGSFGENMGNQIKGMGQLEVKLNKSKLDPAIPSSPELFQIEAKGLIPNVTKKTNIGFVTSVFDSSGKELLPVMSILEEFQENGSVIFQHFCDAGSVNPNEGWASWVPIGAVIPSFLIPPNSGNRKLTIVIRLIDVDSGLTISEGNHKKGHRGLLWSKSIDRSFNFETKGYLEESKDKEEAMSLVIKLGIAVAMSDGSLDDSEGAVIQAWAKKNIQPFSDDKQKRLKKLYNSSMKEAYDSARNGNLSLSVITARLNEIADKATKYEAIEFCYEVMASDGVADSEEMQTIKNIADVLDLNFNEINKIKDRKLVGLATKVSDDASLEDLLGISPSWSTEQTKKHLRVEFQKWNGRLNSMSDGPEKESAQNMLNLVAEARKKYV